MMIPFLGLRALFVRGRERIRSTTVGPLDFRRQEVSEEKQRMPATFALIVVCDHKQRSRQATNRTNHGK
jgi:hypothetical protein